MFKRTLLLLSVFGMLFLFSGCSGAKNTSGFVKGKIQVVVVDRMQNPIKNSQVIFITNNKYLGKAFTDEQGKTGEIEVTAQLDPLVKEIMNKDLRRGVVNIIASKEGYRDDVVFEAWIYENSTTAQIIKLDRNADGERNEPEYTVSEPHRLEIIKYVDYYKSYAK